MHKTIINGNAPLPRFAAHRWLDIIVNLAYRQMQQQLLMHMINVFCYKFIDYSHESSLDRESRF